MTRLPPCRPRVVVRALLRAGFSVHHTTGSHFILRHPAHPRTRVTVPMHNRDLKRGTLASILRQAGLSREDFVELLSR